MSLLVLWDIDGTLLQRASLEHAQALKRALQEVHGDHLEFEGVPVTVAGRTDGAIARDLLAAHGVTGEAVDREVEAVARATCAIYRELCPADLSGKVADGVPELLEEVGARPSEFRSSLVTGNFEQVARLKLERAGIGRFFAAGQGGFGSDAEAREELPPIARARAGRNGSPWPRQRTVVVGDTPNDIACARADGIAVIAVATGPYRVDELAGADHVAGGAAELLPLLEALSAGAEAPRR